uniref:MORN repeat-containing protein 5 n=1 Tax=Glossina brevipalpis TaxID=37001 RepID=A0A1A9WTC8_9MUSC
MSKKKVQINVDESGECKPPMLMRNVNFITGTKWQGCWSRYIKCMQGFGEYTFPDGSVYHGDFKDGKFTGNSVIYLAHPHNFEVRGEFINGKISKITEMRFSDGLVVDADLDGANLNFDRWTYCSGNTRYFACEIFEGIRPVGPTAHLIPKEPGFALRDGEFDTVEGIFNAQTGMIYSRPRPFALTDYVRCEEDRNFITDNFRSAPDSEVYIKTEVCEKILQNNLDQEAELPKSVSCSCITKQDRIRYFPQLVKVSEKTSEKSASSCHINSSSCSEFTSFSTESLIKNIRKELNLAKDSELINYDLTKYKGEKKGEEIILNK